MIDWIIGGCLLVAVGFLVATFVGQSSEVGHQRHHGWLKSRKEAKPPYDLRTNSRHS